MASICTSSLKLSLPNLLRNALRSEFAANLHYGPAHSVTPFTYRRRGVQQRKFSSFPRAQISPSTTYLVSEESSSASPDTASESQPDIQSKPPRGEDSPNEASNAKAESDNVKTQRATPKDDAGTSKKKGKGSDPKLKDKESSKSKDKDSKPKEKGASRKERRSAEGLKKKQTQMWEIQKKALKEKFADGWNPFKKLSPDALEGIRHLHKVAPQRFTTPVLAAEFKVSPEAIRRILKSKWKPTATESEDRRKRWENRHDRIWGHMSELGLRPSTKGTRGLTDANRLLYALKKKTAADEEK
ncbi:mitochondrion organization and biogenesis protein [Aspergillus ellipticus CBS 707.79]|uniref:Required for respiratory growth protein 9, mitochondrial n=1 Tax=Aspergillus ellipticus CBS 707.79 TaxID=1448320 RepID=A0A319CZP4_9EURO|nr:mitochondrion organization and biogenesis protein [Aspergillus ellipticus CBS 707.79]